MKKIAAITVLVMSVVFLLAGCGENSKTAEKKPVAQSPEKVVTQYFTYWKDKDKGAMDKMVLESQRQDGYDPDVELVKTLELKSCKEVPKEDQEEWDPSLFTDPYDFTAVDVEFSITFEGGEGSGYKDGDYASRFLLMKEKKDSDWIIVTWGLG